MQGMEFWCRAILFFKHDLCPEPFFFPDNFCYFLCIFISFEFSNHYCVGLFFCKPAFFFNIGIMPFFLEGFILGVSKLFNSKCRDFYTVTGLFHGDNGKILKISFKKSEKYTPVIIPRRNKRRLVMITETNE